MRTAKAANDNQNGASSRPWQRERNRVNMSLFGMRYGMAAGFLAVAFLVRYALTPLLDHHSPFLFFLPAAMLATLFGGLGPGLAALLAGLFMGDFFFLKPSPGFGGYSLPELTALLSYLLTGGIAISVIEGFHRTRARLHLTEAHERSLEAQVAERTASLEQSLKALEGVLYHVAHDLRAPLRAMHSFSRLLLENYSSNLDSTALDYAQRVSQASVKMDELVQDLLNYGQLGYQQVNCTTVDLWSVLHIVLRAAETRIKSCAAEIRVDGPSPRVWGDPRILEAVFTNLIDNALKFVPRLERVSPYQPQVRIWSSTEEDRVRVYVQDNGIGIAPEYQKQIFGVFERVHLSGSYPGTGIGLAIVQKSVERLGGQVGVESKVGEGSRFWFELKLVARAGSGATESRPTACRSTSPQPTERTRVTRPSSSSSQGQAESVPMEGRLTRVRQALALLRRTLCLTR
jgi:signal transduction histidine kinase